MAIYNVLSYKTGGDGTRGNPWTSPSGTGGIQEAYSALTAAAPPYGAIYAPAAFYKIENPINFTRNLAPQVGQLVGENGVTFYGDGAISTILLARTRKAGSSIGIAIDTTGHGHITLRDFGMVTVATETDRSTVGIYQARGTVGYSVFPQHCNVERVYIDFQRDNDANGGKGTIGIYNTGAETGNYVDLQINADVPLVITSHNIYNIPPSVQGLTPTLVSATNNRILSGAYFSTYFPPGDVAERAAIVLQGKIDNTIVDGAVLQKQTLANQEPKWAVRVLDHTVAEQLGNQIVGVTVRGTQIETWPGVLHTKANLWGLRLQASFSPHTSAEPIRLDGAYARIDGAEIHLTAGNDQTDVKLISDGGGATGGMTNSTIVVPNQMSIDLPQSPVNANRFFSRRTAPRIVRSGTDPDGGQISSSRAGASLGAVALPGKGIVLSTGANENIATGNTSYVRITGPTDAFQIGGFTAFQKTISNVTAGAPAQVTSTAHGFLTGMWVSVYGVTGSGTIANVNNRWKVTLDAMDPNNKFTLDGSNVTGTYTSGGTVSPVPEDGAILHVWNWSAQEITIKHLSTATGWGLRLYTNRGADFKPRQGASDSFVTFIYDREGFVWVLMSFN